MKLVAAIALLGAACGSSAPPSASPAGGAPVASVASVAVDAGVPMPPDAQPDAGVPDRVTSAPAWIFRYHTADRTETWTLRYADGAALLIVESARGAMRYVGTADDAAELALDVSTGSAKLALHCKHAQRALSHKCNDTKAKKLDVLDCYHPDFKEPMPFGKDPGVEYVVEPAPGCNGYRVIAP